MQINFTNKLEKIETDIKPTSLLPVGKVKYLYDDERMVNQIQIGEFVDEEDDSAEDKLRRSFANALTYCKDNGYKNIGIDLSSIDKNFAYVLNVFLEVVDDFVEREGRDMTFSLCARDLTTLESLHAFRRSRPLIETEPQSFGGYGDSLLPKFERFNKKLQGEPLFREYLLDIIDRKGITKYPLVYKASGISKYTFSKVINFAIDPPHQPSRETVAALCIGLKLSLDEAQDFYNVAGYYLGKTDLVDKVVRFFITEKLYEIDEVNLCLLYYGHLPLGEKLRGEKYVVDNKIDI